MESFAATRISSIMLGVVGVIGFGVYHWYYVAPVTAVFFEGMVWAVAAGLAVAWAYQREFLERDRTGPWWGLAFGLLLASTLVPAEALGLLWGPFPAVDSPGTFLAALPLGFTPVPIAIALSWILRGRASIGWSFVVAAMVLNFMVAGSVAQFGGRGVTFLLFVGFVVFEALAGLALHAMHAWLTRGPRVGAPAPEGADGPA